MLRASMYAKPVISKVWVATTIAFCFTSAHFSAAQTASTTKQRPDASEFKNGQFESLPSKAGSISWLFGGFDDYVYNLDTNLLIATLIGTTGFPFDDLFDVDFLPDGRLFGVLADGSLVEIDQSTGAAFFVGSTGFPGTNALVSEANTFYGATDDGEFLRIDATNASTEFVGNYGSGIGSAGDLAVDTDGILFGIVYSGFSCCNPAYLAVIAKETGQATLIGAVGFSDVFGLAFGPEGTLYAVADGYSTGPKLITINKNTGAGALVGQFTGANGIGGLATRPVIFQDGFESGNTSAWTVQ